MARYPHAIVLNCLKALSVDGISPKYLILDSLIYRDCYCVILCSLLCIFMVSIILQIWEVFNNLEGQDIIQEVEQLALWENPRQVLQCIDSVKVNKSIYDDRYC